MSLSDDSDDGFLFFASTDSDNSVVGDSDQLGAVDMTSQLGSISEPPYAVPHSSPQLTAVATDNAISSLVTGHLSSERNVFTVWRDIASPDLQFTVATFLHMLLNHRRLGGTLLPGQKPVVK